MTNKEAYENIGLALKCYLPDNLPKDTKDELQESWDIIRKDLEVLDILKRIVKIVDYSKYPITSLDNQLVILSGGEIKNVEDYDKIKEWLENDCNK